MPIDDVARALKQQFELEVLPKSRMMNSLVSVGSALQLLENTWSSPVLIATLFDFLFGITPSASGRASVVRFGTMSAQ
jgi:hypothetical protein